MTGIGISTLAFTCVTRGNCLISPCSSPPVCKMAKNSSSPQNWCILPEQFTGRWLSTGKRGQAVSSSRDLLLSHRYVLDTHPGFSPLFLLLLDSPPNLQVSWIFMTMTATQENQVQGGKIYFVLWSQNFFSVVSWLCCFEYEVIQSLISKRLEE